MPDKSDKGLKRKTSAQIEDDKAVKKSKAEAPNSETINFIQNIEKCRQDVCSSVDKFKFNKKRVKVLSAAEDFADDSEGVVYWMSRDQRVQDNWALLYAQRLALKLELPLHVCFCLVPKFLDATIRQFSFMLKGLVEVEKECQELRISFHLLLGEAKTVLPDFVKEHKIGGVVTDFSPLRTPMKWVNEVTATLPEGVPFCQVDAHNIVPCWEASPKLEYSARTIRTKIHNVLSSYLTHFPPVCKHPHSVGKPPQPVDWEATHSFLKVDYSVGEVDWATPGTKAAYKMLESFCTQRLKYFDSQRNDPNKPALSNLSPWIHFGQISVQRCIMTVKQYKSRCSGGVDAFIEEAVVRRELADNFCFYNHDHYDTIKGAYKWAQDTLEVHKGDKRSHLYSRQQLEQAKTHDDLWNASQLQMVREGKMHGFLRMYWAKKILEWTPSPEDALREAIYLNDKYNLDGRDPNGYVELEGGGVVGSSAHEFALDIWKEDLSLTWCLGNTAGYVDDPLRMWVNLVDLITSCMWSICGIHDQGWAERPVFGKIRYMNYNGCKRKFDVASFVSKYRSK